MAGGTLKGERSTLRRPAAKPPSVAARKLQSRGAFLLAFAGTALTGTLLYAGPSWAVVLYRLLTDGTTLVLWLTSCAGMGAAALRAAGAAGDGTDRSSNGLGIPLVSSIALGLGVNGLLILLLGLAGWLNRGTAVALLLAGIVLAAICWLRPAARRAAAESLETPAGWEWLLLLAAPFLSIAGVGAMMPAGILWREGDPSFYDVVEYHLQVPREWFEAGRILPLHHNVFSFFPFNVEMHYLFAMHLRGGAWPSMYFAQLMHLGFVGLTVIAVYVLARRASGALPAATGALAVAMTPWMTQLGAVAYDEGGLLLFGTLAIGWTGIAVSEPPERLRRLAIAGVFAGFACGSKLTAVPEVLVPLIATACVATGFEHRQRLSRAVQRGATAGSVLLVSAVLAFSPWLIRNQVWAHNPLFPEAARVLGHGHFTPTQVARWEMAHSPRAEQRSVSARLEAAWGQILASWQYGYVLIPLGLWMAAIARRDRMTLVLVVMLFTLVGVWLLATHLQGRFFVLAIPICGLQIARAPCPKGAHLDPGVPSGGVRAQVAPLGRDTRYKWQLAAVLAAVLAAGSLSLFRLHHDMVRNLYGGSSAPLGGSLVGILGVEDLSPLEQPHLAGLPDGATLFLVGDAKAFWYATPMSRLRYRTVFDVRADTGDAVFDWTEHPLPANAWLLIDPAELERFHQTYWKIPPLQTTLTIPPQDGTNARGPFLMKAPVERQ